MILDNLTTEQLKRVANAFSFDKWKQTFPSEKWKGFDLVGENYIFQLGYEGSIRIFDKENLKEIQLSILQEEKIRKTLNLL